MNQQYVAFGVVVNEDRWCGSACVVVGRVLGPVVLGPVERDQGVD